MTSAVAPIPRWTLDASVVVKWFLRRDEPGRAAALRLREEYRGGRIEIICPDLLAYEIANVLRYKPEIREETAEKAIDSLFLLVILGPVEQADLAAGVRLARRHDLSVYDAVYLAFARRRGCRLLTAERRLCLKLAGAPDVFSLEHYGDI
ncbi:MAG: type II toxin-antitoxin system VapC family toxin [Candidatus Aminicenantes bacterium]|nr:type II toxin-antitoxin system VapC family toxin [Candidatus Aminicenantes bacterium]